MAEIRRPNPDKGNRVIEVAAGLIFREGKLLIAQRHADSHLGGLWEFPGGKRESGESFSQCLQRELKEELGCEVVVGECIQSVTHDYPEKCVYLKFFLCSGLVAEPEPIGCADLRWINRDEMDQFSFPAADEKLLSLLRQRAELWG